MEPLGHLKYDRWCHIFYYLIAAQKKKSDYYHESVLHILATLLCLSQSLSFIEGTHGQSYKFLWKPVAETI